MDYDPTTPLVTTLAIVNAAFLFYRVPRRVQVAVGMALVVLSSVLLKDWIEGFVYLATMP